MHPSFLISHQSSGRLFTQVPEDALMFRRKSRTRRAAASRCSPQSAEVLRAALFLIPFPPLTPLRRTLSSRSSITSHSNSPIFRSRCLILIGKEFERSSPESLDRPGALF
jgi:hypothetical protein